MIAIQILAWVAVFLLALGYWLQVWKIHVHKEVRDLSIAFQICIFTGFAILAVVAIIEESPVFIVKQILTAIPVGVIIFQIIYHKRDTWEDPDLSHCTSCKKDLEKRWKWCPYCGTNA